MCAKMVKQWKRVSWSINLPEFEVKDFLNLGHENFIERSRNLKMYYVVRTQRQAIAKQAKIKAQ